MCLVYWCKGKHAKGSRQMFHSEILSPILPSLPPGKYPMSLWDKKGDLLNRCLIVAIISLGTPLSHPEVSYLILQLPVSKFTAILRPDLLSVRSELVVILEFTGQMALENQKSVSKCHLLPDSSMRDFLKQLT